MTEQETGRTPSWVRPNSYATEAEALEAAERECLMHHQPVVVFAERDGRDTRFRTITRATLDTLERLTPTHYVPLWQISLAAGTTQKRSWNDVR